MGPARAAGRACPAAGICADSVVSSVRRAGPSLVRGAARHPPLRPLSKHSFSNWPCALLVGPQCFLLGRATGAVTLRHSAAPEHLPPSPRGRRVRGGAGEGQRQPRSDSIPSAPERSWRRPLFLKRGPWTTKASTPEPTHCLPEELPGPRLCRSGPPGPTERPVGQRHGRAFPAASVTGPLHGLAEPSASGGITHTLTAL